SIKKPRISHLNADVFPSKTDYTKQGILPPARIQPITNSSRSITKIGVSHLNASVVPSKTDSTTQHILPPSKIQPINSSS
ncbi:Hypothetical protein CINCED_3A008188, partial [Cinara cedri]